MRSLPRLGQKPGMNSKDTNFQEDFVIEGNRQLGKVELPSCFSINALLCGKGNYID
jgi:hypothetical protein